MTAFKRAYEISLDNDLADKVACEMENTELPPSVVAKIITITPSRPDENKIKLDLQDCTLSEGFDREECWFAEEQRWHLKNYEIKDFTIDEVVTDTDSEYIFTAKMRLESDRNAFDAKAKISYVLPEGQDWKLEFVTSLGLSIVQTHKYDDLISCQLMDDGWGGVDAVFVSNNSNVELVVGVEYIADGKCYRVCLHLTPDEKKKREEFLREAVLHLMR